MDKPEEQELAEHFLNELSFMARDILLAGSSLVTDKVGKKLEIFCGRLKELNITLDDLKLNEDEKKQILKLTNEWFEPVVSQTD